MNKVRARALRKKDLEREIVEVMQFDDAQMQTEIQYLVAQFRDDPVPLQEQLARESSMS